MKAPARELAGSALRFLRTHEDTHAEPIVRRFHRWMDAKHIALASLQPDELEAFFRQPFRKFVMPSTANLYKQRLVGYLMWLHRHEIISFHPRQLGLHCRSQLPPQAVSFLRSLEPTHREGTCQAYRSTLHQFHEWLDDASIRINRLERSHTEQWLLALHYEGLHPSTRIHLIQRVRVYLRWLSERDELKGEPDHLLRSRDMPKLPTYLPRPLPANIDIALQENLAKSANPLSKGLLLMRHTGLRIGELCALEYDCIRTDPSGQQFLKVPLGKLNNERLVPLVPRTIEIIRGLQHMGSATRPYLLQAHARPGQKVTYYDMRAPFRLACHGMHTTEPITSHRLRHTYATELLAAGMSLVSVMKLLGHRDYRMTLRYTAITQETVGKEYFAALEFLQARYALDQTNRHATDNPDPLLALTHIAAWVKTRVGHDLGHDRKADALGKRIQRLSEALQPYILE